MKRKKKGNRWRLIPGYLEGYPHSVNPKKPQHEGIKPLDAAPTLGTDTVMGTEESCGTVRPLEVFIWMMPGGKKGKAYMVPKNLHLQPFRIRATTPKRDGALLKAIAKFRKTQQTPDMFFSRRSITFRRTGIQ